MTIQAMQNFHIVTLPQNPQEPKVIVKQAVDNTTGEVLGTLKASVEKYKTYSRGEISSSHIVPSENSIKFAKPHIYVSDLLVYRAARNKGVGTALVADIAKESKERGFMGRLILLAGSNEDSPLPFYKRLGFITNSKNLNNKLDYVVKYRTYISNSIQSFMTLSSNAANKLIKSIL